MNMKLINNLPEANKLIRIFVLINIFILSSNLYPQMDDIKFNHLFKGLSQRLVSCILQDRKGFMWFGTRAGLNEYNGYEFVIYKNIYSDSNSLSNDRIHDILEDKDGNLWIATSGGLNLYKRETNKFIRYIHSNDNGSLSYNIVNTLLEDSKGNLWVGTALGGLDRLNKHENRFVHYKNDVNDSTSLSSNMVRNIFEDRHKNLWIATDDGQLNFYDYNNNNFIHFRFDNGGISRLIPGEIRCIIEDQNGNVWLGTYGSGLILINSYYDSHIHYTQYLHNDTVDNSLSNNNVLSMFMDNMNRLWIGTENGGLNIFDINKKSFKHYKHDPSDEYSICGNSIWSIYQDRNGRVWIGTYDNGLNVIDEYYSKFITYRRQNNNKKSLSHNFVSKFLEDEQGNLWIATNGGGLNYFNRTTKSFVHYRYNKKNINSLSNDAVTSLFKDIKGNLWVGTWGGGINVMHKRERLFIHYNTANSGLTSNYILDIIGDNNGNIIIATHDSGLNIYNPEKKCFSHYIYDILDENSLAANTIAPLYRDNMGQIWMGAQGSGLDLLKKNSSGQVSFTHYRHVPKDPGSLSNYFIESIYNDSRNNLWVGTTNGLNLMSRDMDTFTVFHEEDGLPSNIIHGILEDDQGNLWLSTLNGLSKFNPDTKTFRNYDVSDGLQGNEFSERNASYKSDNGEMFFGGKQGFNVFHPDSIRDNPFIPPVYITDLKIYNKSVGIGIEGSPLNKHIIETKEMTLSYKQLVFSFEFVALNYTHPEKNQYAYIMEGFEKAWNYVGNKREATYTNLKPGKYVFRVKGSNNDDLWNEQGSSIKIIITPPFWRTWWFRILCLIFLALSIYGIIEYRIYGIKKQREKLETLVKERTQDLKTANLELETQKLNISQHAEALKKSNEELEQFANVASHDLKEPLRNIKSYISILAEENASKLNETSNRYIKLALNCTVRMHNLIEDLLSYSKITKKTQSFEPTDCEGVINSVITYLHVIINESNAEISCSNLPTIMADHSQLVQLFQNLITNSIKYSDKKPVIQISAKEKNNEWIFSIKDNGIGIDPQYHDKIFGIFERLHGRSKYSGTGIGLAICKKIIERHGGEIWVESKGEGKGSIFFFTLSNQGESA